MPQIFLSYCRDDQAIARRFAEGLQREGFDVWWDQALNAGQNFDQVTERALKEARAVVVLWTPRSVESRWVRSEATLADRYGTLVPAMLEPCERPIMFELTHTADLHGWKGDANDPRWQSFVAGLHSMVSGDGIADRAAGAASRARPTGSGRGLIRDRRMRWAAVAVCALGAAGLAAWLLPGNRGESTAVASNPPANLPDGLEALAAARGSGKAGMYRLTDFEGIEEHAAISRDGKVVAFVSDRDGPRDIWITRIGTSEFRNLTNGRNLPQYSPETRVLGFSADGAEIHYSTRLTNEGNTIINAWSMPVLGGALRPLLDGAVETTWSPDGKRLAYHTSAPGDPTLIHELNGAPDRQVLISAPGEHNHAPTWSPDGAYLYYLHGSDVLNGMELWRVSAAGGTPEQMTSPPRRMIFPTFLDPRTLAFLAEESKGAGMSIHLLDVETRKVRSIQAGLERFTSLAASDSGKRLVATMGTQRSSLWRIQVNTDKVAQQAQRLRVSTRGSTSPRRAGSALLYISSSESGSGIWRSDGESSSEIWSPARGTVVGSLAVAPDGRRIAFAVLRDGTTQLHIGNAEGTDMRPLAQQLRVHGSPAWSPDSRWIAVAADTPAGPRLYRIDAASGETSQLTQQFAVDPTWSPQGGFLVYASEQVGPIIRLAAVTAGGQPHQIAPIMLPRGSSRTAFLPGADAAAQLVVMDGDLQQTDFWTVDVTSGKKRRLTELGAEYQLGDFDLSADGKEILFDRVREESDVVVIDLE